MGAKLAALVLLALAALIYFFKGTSYMTRSVPDKGNIVVYGSRSCPWCQKQETYLNSNGIPYTFVDCNTEQCPGFVNGFPTILKNGEILEGYTEL